MAKMLKLLLEAVDNMRFKTGILTIKFKLSLKTLRGRLLFCKCNKALGVNLLRKVRIH